MCLEPLPSRVETEQVRVLRATTACSGFRVQTACCACRSCWPSGRSSGPSACRNSRAPNVGSATGAPQGQLQRPQNLQPKLQNLQERLLQQRLLRLLRIRGCQSQPPCLTNLPGERFRPGLQLNLSPRWGWQRFHNRSPGHQPQSRPSRLRRTVRRVCPLCNAQRAGSLASCLR